MGGREWHPKGEPVPVEDHSFFTGPDVEQAIPYGIYDIAHNTGWVNAGVDHDTSVFAVESIRRWWKARGSLAYPDASRLLITADAGGSNGYRYRVWKSELAALSAETGLAITVCHFPPGTSKWNKIEHRLFSHITMNWRGRPLTSHEVVVQTIAATRNRGGLHVEAALDTGDYPIGVAISKKRMAALPLERHATHGTWNYTLCPRQASSSEAAAAGEAGGPAWRRQAMLHRLADPRLTGMTAAQLQQLAGQLAPSQAARAQQRYSQQRGGRARRATGNPRGKPLFDDAARLLLTLLYQRQVCSMNVLADLLEVTATCIGDLVRETREVLEDHGHQAGVAPVRFATPDALLAFLGSDLRPARTEIIDRLSHPALTGLTRGALHSLTERLAARQAAQTERLSHQRRGGLRQPGTRGGVFPQKITNSERVLLTILYQRRLSSTRGDCAPWTSSPAPSATSADPRSATSSAKLSHSSSRKATFRTTHRAATAHQPISSLQRQPATTRRQVDSLRLHRARNILAKVPAGMQAEVKDAYWKIFGTEDLKTPPGPKLAEIIDARITEMAARYAPTYPAAMKCLTTDAAGLTAYLRFPAGHHQRIRHSNFIERTFGETRRRTKVIGRLPGETSCLTLIWAVLDRASAGWRGLNMTPDGLRLLQDLRRSLLDPPRQLQPRIVTTSQPADGSETVSTVA